MEKSCGSRSFKALMVTQAFGALNDNTFKMLLLLLIGAEMLDGGGGINQLIYMSVIFVAPFILFSTFAGSLADRFSKTTIIRGSKIFELVVVCLAAYLYPRRETEWLLVLLFLMGVESAIFSPPKYGILPEILSEQQLSKGNGYLQLWSFIAIIFGSAIGGVLYEFAPRFPELITVVLVSLALVGLAASFLITKTPAADSGAKLLPNPFGSARDVLEIRKHRGLYLSLLGVSFFWSLAALYQLNIYLYARQMGGFSELQTSMLMTILGLGIGVGSVASGLVSAGKVELGLVPIGAAGVTFFSAALSLVYQSYLLASLSMGALGICCGLFIVPVNAYLQNASPADRRGRFLAAANWLSNIGVLIFSFSLLFLVGFLRFSPAQVFVLGALLMAAITIYLCFILPAILMRCVNWLLVHTVYSLKVIGAENVPAEGGGLLVCNHVSYIDPLLLCASLGRPVRFLMYKPMYEKKFIRPLAELMKAIPISMHDSPKDVIRSLTVAREAIESGELVGIFSEGGVTRSGNLLPFLKGFERIMKGLQAPIIPVHLDQVWGSIFSFKDGKIFWKIPREIPYPVTVSYGKPLPPTTQAFQVRQVVQELGADAAQFRKKMFQSLPAGFLRLVKRYPFRPCLVDSGWKQINYLQAFLQAKILSAALDEQTVSGEMVGVFLPPSINGAVANIGVLFAGLVPVNLDCSAADEHNNAIIDQCQITKIISSRKVIESEWKLSGRVLYLEDLVSDPSLLKNLWYLSVLFLPQSLVERLYFKGRPCGNDLAAVIFSADNAGKSRGVMLSHANIASNVEAVCALFQFGRKDCVLGILPFSGALGLIGTLWLPLLAGVKAVYYDNAQDTEMISNLISRYKVTILVVVPSLLDPYAEKCAPELLTALKRVFTGVEELEKSAVDRFERKFGLRPIVGYGCDELSSVTALNIDDYQVGKWKQVGGKEGSVGQPLPSIAAKVVDPQSFEDLGAEKEGLLLIKGPNLMLGYLGNKELTDRVIRNGWYSTGDVARVDGDGFITIISSLSNVNQ